MVDRADSNTRLDYNKVSIST
jgi:hypothetical protein